jgi:arylsulfatase A-like enzyme
MKTTRIMLGLLLVMVITAVVWIVLRRTEIPVVPNPIRLLDDKNILEECRRNLAAVPKPMKERLLQLLRDNLQVGPELASNPVFPCMLLSNSRSLETRRSVLLQAPVTLKTRISMPPEAGLEFYFGLIPSDDEGYYGGEIRIQLLDNSGRVLSEKSKSLYGTFRGRWHHERLDLSQVSTGEVDLEITLSGQPSDPPCVLLGEPVIRSFQNNIDQQPPNIILICLDALRADHLSTMGYQRETTPVLDKIASEGVLFTQAFSQSGFTLPSHKSFLSGYYPQLFDYYSNTKTAELKKLTGQIPLIQHYLKSRGYYNVAFTGGVFVGASFGFYSGFDLYNQIINQMRGTADEKEGGRICKDSGFDNAIEWLRENGKGGPFFMFLHTYGIHASYAPPPEYDALFETEGKSKLGPTIARKILWDFNEGISPEGSISSDDIEQIKLIYDRGIRWIDDKVGGLYNCIDSLGILDNTILIILSDHGEEFYEHGKFEHKRLYEQDLHVPLIIRSPRLFPKGKTIGTKVELVDVVPTLFDILGIKPKPPIVGRSLVPIIRGAGGEAQRREGRPIFGSQREWKSVRLGDYKYHVLDGDPAREMLFNLREDPLEQNNLIGSAAIDEDTLRDLRLRMLYYLAENHGGWNLIVFPQARHRYLIDINGLETEHNLIPQGKKYKIVGNDMGIYINQFKVRLTGRLGLLCFEGKFDEKFSIGILKGALNDADSTPQNINVLIGLTDDRTRLSPVDIFNNTRFGGAFPIHDGLPRELTRKYEAILWKSNFNIMRQSDSRTDEIPEETLRELRDFGYIH